MAAFLVGDSLVGSEDRVGDDLGPRLYTRSALDDVSTLNDAAVGSKIQTRVGTETAATFVRSATDDISTTLADQVAWVIGEHARIAVEDVTGVVDVITRTPVTWVRRATDTVPTPVDTATRRALKSRSVGEHPLYVRTGTEIVPIPAETTTYAKRLVRGLVELVPSPSDNVYQFTGTPGSLVRQMGISEPPWLIFSGSGEGIISAPQPLQSGIDLFDSLKNEMRSPWIRVEFQVPGSDRSNKIYQFAKARGMKICAIAHGSTAWGGLPNSLAAWATSLIANYPDIDAIEVGNEPNSGADSMPSGYRGNGAGQPLTVFAQALILLYDRVKSIKPDTIVLTPGLTAQGVTDSTGSTAVDWLNELMAACNDYFVANGTYPWDGVSMHPYGFNQDINPVTRAAPINGMAQPWDGTTPTYFSWSTTGASVIVNLHNAVVARLAKLHLPDTHPCARIFCTEWGIPSAIDNPATGYVHRTTITAANAAVYIRDFVHWWWTQLYCGFFMHFTFKMIPSIDRGFGLMEPTDYDVYGSSRREPVHSTVQFLFVEAATGASYARSGTETIAAPTDSATRRITFVRALGDNAGTVTDGVTSVLTRVRRGAETLPNVTDNATHPPMQFVRSASDTAEVNGWSKLLGFTWSALSGQIWSTLPSVPLDRAVRTLFTARALGEDVSGVGDVAMEGHAYNRFVGDGTSPPSDVARLAHLVSRSGDEALSAPSDLVSVGIIQFLGETIPAPSDTAERMANTIVRSALDTVPVPVDVVTRSQVHTRAAVETVAEPSDVGTRYLEWRRVAVDNITGISDAATKGTYTAARRASDTVIEPTDAATWSDALLARTADETLDEPIDEATSIGDLGIRTGDETVDEPTDVAEGIKMLARDGAETVAEPTDATVEVRQFARTGVDAPVPGLSDHATRVKLAARSITETVTAPTDAAIGGRRFVRAASDTVDVGWERILGSPWSVLSGRTWATSAPTDVATRIGVFGRQLAEAAPLSADTAVIASGIAYVRSGFEYIHVDETTIDNASSTTIYGRTGVEILAEPRDDVAASHTFIVRISDAAPAVDSVPMRTLFKKVSETVPLPVETATRRGVFVRIGVDAAPVADAVGHHRLLVRSGLDNAPAADGVVRRVYAVRRGSDILAAPVEAVSGVRNLVRVGAETLVAPSDVGARSSVAYRRSGAEGLGSPADAAAGVHIGQFRTYAPPQVTVTSIDLTKLSPSVNTATVSMSFDRPVRAWTLRAGGESRFEGTLVASWVAAEGSRTEDVAVVHADHLRPGANEIRIYARSEEGIWSEG